MTRAVGVLLGIAYATAAFILGIQTKPNRILFAVVVIMSAIAFTFALDTHERMNGLRRRGDNY